jgi:SET domain-containing protein
VFEIGELGRGVFELREITKKTVFEIGEIQGKKVEVKERKNNK